MVDGVVEQPVGEVLEGLPVGGIEGIFRSEPAQRHDRSLELQALAADLGGHSLSKHDEGLEHAGGDPAQLFARGMGCARLEGFSLRTARPMAPARPMRAPGLTLRTTCRTRS